VFRINKMSDYGTVIMGYVATQAGRQCSAADIASQLGLGLPTVGKILKRLAREKLVAAKRGRRGGYYLARQPARISLAEIIDALTDRPFGLTECSGVEGICAQEASCQVRANWRRINAAVRRLLEGVSLRDFTQGNSLLDSGDGARVDAVPPGRFVLNALAGANETGEDAASPVRRKRPG